MVRFIGNELPQSQLEAKAQQAPAPSTTIKKSQLPGLAIKSLAVFLGAVETIGYGGFVHDLATKYPDYPVVPRVLSALYATTIYGLMLAIPVLMYKVAGEDAMPARAENI